MAIWPHDAILRVVTHQCMSLKISMTNVLCRNHLMSADPASSMLQAVGNQATVGVSFVTCHKLNERHPKHIEEERTREREREIEREGEERAR